MTFPSLSLVAKAASRTARRFPLVLTTAFVAAFAAAVSSGNGSHPDLTRLLLTAMLGLPLLFALAVLAEQQGASGLTRTLIQFAGVLVLMFFWRTWSEWSSPVQFLRYVQLSVAFHLLVAFSPYLKSRGPNGFWQYNRILFLRFLTACLYSVVLYAGLSIALAAVNKLFGVPIGGEAYWRLWIVISFAFHPWFFLAGVPDDLAALDSSTDYPTGLRVFTQYVLIPIVALYLGILMVYLAKVVFTREWPKGWIGYLVSSVATVGILSWLLVFPLEDRKEYAWVKPFTRGFYFVLMPAIVMLWLAIYTRVAQYGITERRYFLIVMSAWLAGVALYYTLTRSRNIKLIPASLCALALATFAGPTGAYAVSRRSQVTRLHILLARNAMLDNGKLRRAPRDVPFNDRLEISGALRYIISSHGAIAIAPLLSDSVNKVVSQRPTNEYAAESDARAVMASIGVDYVARGTDTFNPYFSVAAMTTREGIAIDGYAYALNLYYLTGHDSLKVTTGVIVRLSSDSTTLLVTRDGQEILQIPVAAVARGARDYQRTHANASIPRDVMRSATENDAGGALAYFTSISGFDGASGLKITQIAGDLFLRVK